MLCGCGWLGEVSYVLCVHVAGMIHTCVVGMKCIVCVEWIVTITVFVEPISVCNCMMIHPFMCVLCVCV